MTGEVLGRLLLYVAVALAVTWGVGGALPVSGITGNAAALLVGSLAAGWSLLRLEGRGPGALGFHLAPSAPREGLAGGAVGVGLALLVVAAVGGLGGVAWSPEGGSVSGWLVGAGSAAAFLALPAAAEEALVRGYPLQLLTARLGAGWGMVLTAMVFGALHGANPGATVLGAVNTGAAGLFLGAIYLRTGSLWWATGAHLGWNWGLGYLADLPVSGVDVADAPWVGATPAGPWWLGGGDFGPEGSVVATAAFLAAAAACWWGPWLRVEPAARIRRPLAVLERDEKRAPARSGPDQP